MKNKTTAFIVFLLLVVFSSYGLAEMNVTIERIAFSKGTFSFDEPVKGAVYVRNTGDVPFYGGHLFVDIVKEKENVIPSQVLEDVGYYVIRNVSLLPGEEKDFPINASISEYCGGGQYRAWVELASMGNDRRDYKDKEFLMQGGHQAVDYPVGMNVSENPLRKYGTPAVAQGSEITGSTAIKNLLSTDADYVVQFSVYPAFDDLLWENPVITEDQDVKLAPMEKKTVELKFPMSVAPGSYTVLLSVLKDGSLVALDRRENIHVDGISGTIVDLYPDKDAYNPGDVMVLHYAVGGPLSPSNLKRELQEYPESAKYQPANTVPSPLTLKLNVDYMKGNVAVQSASKDVQITDIYANPLIEGDWKIDVKNALYNYTIKASVTDTGGNVLDTTNIVTYTNKEPETTPTTPTTLVANETTTHETIPVTTTEASQATTTLLEDMKTPATDSNIYVLFIILAAVIVLVLYLMRKMKGKKGTTGMNIWKTGIILLAAITLVGLSMPSVGLEFSGRCQCDEGKLICSCGNGNPEVCPGGDQTPATTILGAPAGGAGSNGYIIRQGYCECTGDKDCLFPDNCEQACCKTKVTDCSARVCMNGDLYTGTASGNNSCTEANSGCATDCCQQYCGGSCGVCQNGACTCNYACMTDQDCTSTSNPCAENLCQSAGTCQASCVESDDNKPNLKLVNSDVSESQGTYMIQASLKNDAQVGAVIDNITFNTRSYSILSKPSRISAGSGSIFTAKTDSGTMLALPGSLRATIDYSSEANQNCKVSSTFDLGGVNVLQTSATEQVYAMDVNGMCVNHYYSCYSSRPDNTLYAGYKCFKGPNYNLPTNERINLGFDLKGLPDGMTIKSAMLSFKVKNAVKPQDITIYTATKDDWTGQPNCEAKGDVCGPSYCKDECSQIFDIGDSAINKEYIADTGEYTYDVTAYIGSEYAGDKYASFQIRGDEDVWITNGQASCTKEIDWEPQDIQIEDSVGLIVTYK